MLEQAIPLLLVVIGLLIGSGSVLVYVHSRCALLRNTPSKLPAEYRNYNLKIKQLKVVTSEVQCLVCGDTISANHNRTVACSCGEVFVHASATYLIIGARDYANMRDNTVVTTDNFTA